MLNIIENIDLKQYATMRLPAQAKYFVAVANLEELKQALGFAEQKHIQFLILGEGSNTLFIDDVDSLVIKIELQGIEIIEQDEETVLLKAQAGENWDDFVLHTVNEGLYGLENLSWIPGSVGAAPVQNIGAYGVELSDCLEWVEIFNISTQQLERLSTAQCELAYRDSVFKGELKDKVIITAIAVRLKKQAQFNLGYAALTKEFENEQQEITAMQVRNAVIKIRDSKLPNPQQLPNAGSFFKNPIISLTHYHKLLEKFPAMPSYPVSETHCKIPAAWLIEQAGWKGKQYKNVAVHDKQALVLINNNNGTGEELLKLSDNIRKTVFNNYQIKLEIEPKIV